MNNFFLALFGFMIGVFIVGAFFIGTDASGRADCKTWAIQATEYPGFYITQWQKSECDYYSIPVNAPIR